MYPTFIHKLFLFACLVLPLFGEAQATFTATVYPIVAAKNEFITLRLTVENGKAVKQITPPSFNDFTVQGGPSQEQSINEINGITTQSVSLTYILKAKKPGSFILANSTALVDGKILKAKAVKITINNKDNVNAQQNVGSASNNGLFFEDLKPSAQYEDYIIKKGENIAEKINKNMQLLLQTNKTTCYVGEPILATYKLYTRLPTESSISKNPSFSGFSVIDMVPQNAINEQAKELLQGRMYNTYTLRKSQLYPLQAGIIELEVATIDNSVTLFQHEKNNPTNNTPFIEKVTLSSKPISIKVKPLPDINVPNSFAGAVGQFAIEASLDKNIFTTAQTGLLRIKITGEGNMHLLTLPTIEWPNDIEFFDPKIIDNINNTTLPINGTKTFEIPFVISKIGKYILPEISFSYFNPTNSSYKILKIDTLSCTITKATEAEAAIIKNLKPVSTSNEQNFFANKYIYAFFFLLIAILLYSIFYFYKKQKSNLIIQKKVEEPNIYLEQKMTKPTNKYYLEKTNECLQKNECVDFYAILLGEIKYFLAEKLLIPQGDINAKNISLEMDKLGIDNHLSLQTQQLIQQIEKQVYTPFERNEKLSQYFTKAQLLIEQIKLNTKKFT